MPLGGANLPLLEHHWCLAFPFLEHQCPWPSVWLALEDFLDFQVWGAPSFLWYFAQVKSESESGSCSIVSDFLRPHGLYSPWHSPDQNTGVGSLSLLREIFPTQGLNPGLPHCRWILYQLSHKGSAKILEWVAYPSSSRSSWPRNRTGVSGIAGGLYQLSYHGSPNVG